MAAANAPRSPASRHRRPPLRATAAQSDQREERQEDDRVELERAGQPEHEPGQARPARDNQRDRQEHQYGSRQIEAVEHKDAPGAQQPERLGQDDAPARDVRRGAADQPESDADAEQVECQRFHGEGQPVPRGAARHQAGQPQQRCRQGRVLQHKVPIGCVAGPHQVAVHLEDANRPVGAVACAQQQVGEGQQVQGNRQPEQPWADARRGGRGRGHLHAP